MDSNKKKHVLQWHLTHACNLRCTHCYQDNYAQSFGFVECLNVLQQYKSFCEKNNLIGHINFTGGEPFLMSCLFKVLDECEYIGFTFGILTNGTLLSNEIVNKLSKYKNLKFVQISIDGTKEVHDSIRGNGNFRKAFDGIKLLHDYNIQTMVAFTCHKSNQKYLKKVIHYCRHHYVDRFWADRLIPVGNNKEQILSTEEYRDIIKTLTNESKKKGMIVHTNRALQWCEGSNEIYHCSAGVSILVLLADGTLLPCRRLPLSIGNVFEQSISELYDKSDIIADLKKQTIPNECQKCLKASMCRGGAKCLNYAITGNYNIKDINCYMQSY